jgi:hypothetical protein
MKRLFYLSLTILILVFISGCRSYVSSAHSVYPEINFTAKANIEVDVVVDTTKFLEGKSTTTVVFKIFKSSDNKFVDTYSYMFGDKEKKAAMYKALDGSGYDVIFNPKYKIEYYRGLFVSKTTCTVKGYGAKYIYKTIQGNVNDFNFNSTKPLTSETKVISNPRKATSPSSNSVSFNWNSENYIGEIVKEETDNYLIRVSINGVIRELSVPKSNVVR